MQTECGSRVKVYGRLMYGQVTLEECWEWAGRGLGRTEPRWNWICQRMSETRRMGWKSHQVITGRPETMSVHSWVRQETWLHKAVKTEVLNIFFTSVLTSKSGLQGSRPQKPQGKSGARNACPWWKRIRLQILKQIMHPSVQGAWWDECWGSWLMSLRGNSWHLGMIMATGRGAWRMEGRK